MKYIGVAVVFLVLLVTCASSACASTNTDGTCASCTDATTQFGPQCVACPCRRGTCFGGVSGNGMCVECDALSFGAYCDRGFHPNPLLLNWTQICCCTTSFGMVVVVVFVFVRVTLSVRAGDSADAVDIVLQAQEPNRFIDPESSDRDEPEIKFFVSQTKREAPHNDPYRHLPPKTAPIVSEYFSPRPSAVQSRLSREPLFHKREVSVVPPSSSSSDTCTCSETRKSHTPIRQTSSPHETHEPVGHGVGPRRQTGVSTNSSSFFSVSPPREQSNSLHAATISNSTTTADIASSPSQLPRCLAALPRFRVGDRIRRNTKEHQVLCDFGGAVGEIYCGEEVVVDKIIVNRSSSTVKYGFTVVNGDREPSVEGIEELFDLATSLEGSEVSSDF